MSAPSSSSSSSSAAASAGTAAPVCPPGYEMVTEGKASVIFPQGEVFYNKVQCFNRDLSILMIKLFIKQRRAELKAKADKKAERRNKFAVKDAEEKGLPPPEPIEPESVHGVRILEALSASGLRSMRFWKEIPEDDTDIDYLMINDLDATAVESIKRNLEINGINSPKVVANCGDASLVMMQHQTDETGFDVIDLDPYGTAAPFMEPAMHSIKEGGLLLVTCTDKAVLCGNNSEACFHKYGVMSLRGPFCHEMAVRIVLASLAKAAARYKKYIVPVLSLSIDFYVRVFVRVFTSGLEVKKHASKLSHVYSCTGCPAFHLSSVGKMIVKGRSMKFSQGTGPPVDRNCADCKQVFKIGGPIWNGPLHDLDWVSRAQSEATEKSQRYHTAPRINAMLSVVEKELPDVPLFYTLPSLCKPLHVSGFKMVEMRSALMRGGFRVSGTHGDPNGFKTDAPPDILMDVMRCHAKRIVENGGKLRKFTPESPAAHILAKEPTFQADFSVLPEAVERHSGPRFLPNPEAEWGPGTRAKKRKLGSIQNQQERRKANQGKNSKKKVNKPCHAWNRYGSCTRGDTCRYVHDPSAVTATSNNTSGDAGAGPSASTAADMQVDEAKT